MNYQHTSKVLKALSDPKRLRIVHMLSKGPMGASRLLEAFEVSQPTLSHDMHVLLGTGLVIEERRGKTVTYQLSGDAADAFLVQLTDALTLAEG